MGAPPVAPGYDPQTGGSSQGVPQQGFDQGAQPPPAYMPPPGSPAPYAHAQFPPHHQIHQAQSHVQSHVQYIQQPDGTVQAVQMIQPMYNGLLPSPQPVLVMASPPPPQNPPSKGNEPTVVINNTNTTQQQTAVAHGSTTDSCLAGACGACMACMFCCTIM